MPNWVKNKIIVGNSEFGRRLIDKYSTLNKDTKEIEFDFNKVIEMPKELQIEFSSKSDSALCLYLTRINPLITYYGLNNDKLDEDEYNKLINKFKDKTTVSTSFTISKDKINELILKYDEDELLSLGERQVDNVVKYNAINWYEWSISNWGTKWNASNFKTSDNNRILMFETAWEPVREIIVEISKQNPDIKFGFLYSDEAIGSHVGYLLLKAGHIDFEGTFEDYSVDAYKLAFDLWECEDDYEYDQELGTYALKEDSEESFIN